MDEPVEGEKNAWVGRTYADAPDVDGVVYVTGKKLRPGQIVPCEIVATRDYDLIGAAVGKPRTSWSPGFSLQCICRSAPKNRKP